VARTPIHKAVLKIDFSRDSKKPLSAGENKKGKQALVGKTGEKKNHGEPPQNVRKNEFQRLYTGKRGGLLCDSRRKRCLIGETNNGN